jgi:hypothetical protein
MKKFIFVFQKILNKMDSSKLIELISYTFPAVITGFVAYSFFKAHTKNEEGRRRYLLQKESKKSLLPIRLQAYERLTLLMERINPAQLLVRIAPFSENKSDYENLLIANIDQEFEHNLAQQIYVSDDCWTILTTAKSTTVQMIRKASLLEKITTAHELREFILNDLLEKKSPSDSALPYLKNEVAQLW